MLASLLNKVGFDPFDDFHFPSYLWQFLVIYMEDNLHGGCLFLPIGEDSVKEIDPRVSEFLCSMKKMSQLKRPEVGKNYIRI